MSSRSDLIATEIEVIEARIQLAEAQKNSGEIIKLLDELVIQRQADRNLTEELFKGGAISAEKLNKADARLADAKVRLSKAKDPPKP